MRLRADGPPAAEALGEAHQNCDPSLPSPKGIGDGTAPLHGAKSASSAWRGGGIVTAPCASTLATNTKAKVARTIGVVATIAARASIIAPPASAITVGCAPRGKGKMASSRLGSPRRPDTGLVTVNSDGGASCRRALGGQKATRPP